jgi:hypothetical protein
MPGISIVSQAILPGKLNLLFADVLPAPYHGIAHWRSVICWDLVSWAYLLLRPELRTGGKNVNKLTTNSQFSFEGGIQF